ncbi:MAG: 4Fe-4S binding protein [Candidatus Aminicenantes bacterium]|nr:4Fe-4S binding protein [Candidatus Aminicenantes bacterium]
MNAARRIGIAAAAGFGFLLTPLTLAAQQAGRGRPAGFLDVLQRPKFVAMLVLGIAALALLLTKKMRNGIKVPFLLLSTFLFGIAANLPVKAFSGFSMHPSPICSVAKAVLYGFRTPMMVTLAVILFLTLVGPKLFCGWVCPVGAAQELVAMLADKLGIRRRRWNFRFSQGVRVGLLLLFIFLSGTAILHTVQGEQAIALSLYDYINAFHGFEIVKQPTVMDTVIHFLPFLLTLAFAFVVYRPFCYLVCPIGLVTNLVEPLGLFRVVRTKPACADCGVCTAKSPCPTVPEILKDAAVRPDCFSCAVCVNSCPSGELEFRVR